MPDKFIMDRTGHTDRGSLLTYERPDVFNKQAVSFVGGFDDKST